MAIPASPRARSSHSVLVTETIAIIDENLCSANTKSHTAASNATALINRNKTRNALTATFFMKMLVLLLPVAACVAVADRALESVGGSRPMLMCPVLSALRALEDGPPTINRGEGYAFIVPVFSGAPVPPEDELWAAARNARSARYGERFPLCLQATKSEKYQRSKSWNH